MQKFRLLILTVIGSGLEYYDFVIYALSAHYISQTFFPGGAPWLDLFKTLFIFATGYIVRPIGGMIFGSLGDRFGRKKSFTTAILLMALATLGIAILPSYAHWGIASAVLLALFRVLQGISQGAELPGALTFMFEHADQKQRGFLTSVVTSGVGLGAMLGSFVYFILHGMFTEVQMQAYAWRFAFVIGGMVAIFSYLLRRYTLESPLFAGVTIADDHQPLRQLIKTHRREVLTGIGLTLFAGCFIIYFLFIPQYLQQYFHYDPKLVYLLTTLGLGWSALLLPVCGRLSDTIGSQQQMRLSLASMVIGAPLMFYSLHWQNTAALIIFIFLYQTSTACLAACYPFLLANLFPTEVRYSGTALTYNTAFAIAGFTPLITAGLLHRFDSAMVIPLFFSGLALLSFIAVSLYDSTPDALAKQV